MKCWKRLAHCRNHNGNLGDVFGHYRVGSGDEFKCCGINLSLFQPNGSPYVYTGLFFANAGINTKIRGYYFNGLYGTRLCRSFLGWKTRSIITKPRGNSETFSFLLFYYYFIIIIITCVKMWVLVCDVWKGQYKYKI